MEYRFVVVQTVKSVQIHCLNHMIKATKKHGYLPFKIVNIKNLLQMRPVQKVRKFNFFLFHETSTQKFWG